MAKLSLAELESIVASYVDEDKISIASFSETANNTAGLLDKIGRIITLDTSFIDKLAMFDGAEMRFGKTIEEWQADLILPQDYSSSGEGALSPHDPSYRPVDYSYTLGRKVIATTIRNNDLERAVNNAEEFVSIVSMITKRLYDSVAVWKYGVKREMLAKLIALCSPTATTYVQATAYSVGAVLKSSSEVGVCVKAIKASDNLTWAQVKSGGYVVLYSLVEELAIPSSAETGEAFIKAVKTAVEQAQDVSEGHSLNGNCLGASDGLVLLVKQGVIPAIEVDVMAGAFQQQRVAIPAEVKVIKDFGGDTTGVYAMLIDKRGIALFNTYRSTKEQMNGAGDFLNLFYHTEDTAHISRNTFVKVFKAPSGE